MRPLRASTLLVVGVVAAGLAWGVLGALDGSGVSLPLPWTVPVVLVVLAGVVLWVGLPVRRWLRGARERPLDALRAARAVVLAQAGIVTGVALAGVYVGITLVFVPTVAIEPRRADLLMAMLAVAASLALLVTSVLVQRWCRLPPGDDDHDAPRPGASSPEAADPHDSSHSHARPPGSRSHPGSR